MPKIRVLVVDDAVVIRRLLSDCLGQDPDIEVAGTAANGQIGLAKIDQLNPDVVTLDIEMPVMDGLQMLAEIRKTHPKLPVIMFSTQTERGAAVTLDALSRGASDYVFKPSFVGSAEAAITQTREELIPKIKKLCQRNPARIISAQANNTRPRNSGSPGKAGILAIGVSTGGPNALAEMLPGLAQNFPIPIVIVQHMPPLFTRLLSERLAATSGLAAREGASGTRLRNGEVCVAPGGFHMEVENLAGVAQVRLHQGPLENSCRPAVDVLFRSVARAYGPSALAVVLTGMGQDGLRGCECIAEAGGQVLVQDEASSVVWGMPGAVAQAGLAHKILPLCELAAEINRRVLPSASPVPSLSQSTISAQPALAKTP